MTNSNGISTADLDDDGSNWIYQQEFLSLQTEVEWLRRRLVSFQVKAANGSQFQSGTKLSKLETKKGTKKPLRNECRIEKFLYSRYPAASGLSLNQLDRQIDLHHDDALGRLSTVPCQNIRRRRHSRHGIVIIKSSCIRRLLKNLLENSHQRSHSNNLKDCQTRPYNFRTTLDRVRLGVDIASRTRNCNQLQSEQTPQILRRGSNLMSSTGSAYQSYTCKSADQSKYYMCSRPENYEWSNNNDSCFRATTESFDSKEVSNLIMYEKYQTKAEPSHGKIISKPVERNLCAQASRPTIVNSMTLRVPLPQCGPKRYQDTPSKSMPKVGLHGNEDSNDEERTKLFKSELLRALSQRKRRAQEECTTSNRQMEVITHPSNMCTGKQKKSECFQTNNSAVKSIRNGSNSATTPNTLTHRGHDETVLEVVHFTKKASNPKNNYSSYCPNESDSSQALRENGLTSLLREQSGSGFDIQSTSPCGLGSCKIKVSNTEPVAKQRSEEILKAIKAGVKLKKVRTQQQRKSPVEARRPVDSLLEEIRTRKKQRNIEQQKSVS